MPTAMHKVFTMFKFNFFKDFGKMVFDVLIGFTIGTLVAEMKFDIGIVLIQEAGDGFQQIFLTQIRD